MTFEDHFSGGADEYARYRPRYPDDLFRHLASIAVGRSTAWDCATGSGQAAVGLARWFSRVVATDASCEQIDRATVHPRVSYHVAHEEASGIAGSSVDLVVIAQALHWFDFPSFYREARRVLKSSGVLAAWSYDLMTISPAVDRLIGRLYHETLVGNWPVERGFVSDRYASLPFPLVELDAPSFEMTADWDFDEVTGYLGTWSAVRRYQAHQGIDPVLAIRPSLAEVWGASGRKRAVRWPLSLRVGRFE